jgi:hypothetical protein
MPPASFLSLSDKRTQAIPQRLYKYRLPLVLMDDDIHIGSKFTGGQRRIVAKASILAGKIL